MSDVSGVRENVTLAPPVLDRRSDVVVIGSGVAGLTCALSLAPRSVTLITKTARPEGGSSLLAQGGIAAAIGSDDSPADHAQDTISAGAGLCVQESILDFVSDGADLVRGLITGGVPSIVPTMAMLR